MITPDRGLCSSCQHARVVVSGKGSRFVLCERSRTDDRFPRYPSLPVTRCAGYDPVALDTRSALLDASGGTNLDSADQSKNGL